MPDEFTKAFNKLHAEAACVADAEDVELQQARKKEREDQQLREREGPMTALDAIPRILQAWKDSDYLRLLALPPVEVDAMGRPTWECTDADISRAYRRLSIFVHPDKPANQNNPEAREAFERLNEAHRILKDPAKRSDEMNKRLEEAKARRALAEAQATVADRVVINAARTQAAIELRKEEEAQLADKLRSQVQQRREVAQQKMMRRAQARPRQDSDDEPAAPQADAKEGSNRAKGSDSDDEDVARRIARLKNSKRRRK